MSSITIELPESVRESFKEQEPELSRLTLEALAVEGYRRADLSHRQVGQMLGLDYWQAEAFLKAHRVFPNYDVEDLEQDRRTFASLKQANN